MRFGSVCSGIEAASVAWHPLGWEAAWLSEIEPFPCAVLKHHYPDVPNHGDMTLLPEKILQGEVEAPDLFCGGTPCQAFSVAGLRNSLDDARGNLSLTFVGIANAIDHVRSLRRDAPAIIFWENVPGVLNTKDNAFGCFLGALAGENDPIIPPGDKWSNAGCVYGPQRAVAWRVLDAQYFGVAQRRRRVFVIASARDDIDPAEILFEFESVRRDTAPSRQTGQRAPSSAQDSSRVSSGGLQGRNDCGVELSGPLSARDYKDAGTDGMNKISAKMIPAVYENHPADSRVKDMGEVCSTVTSRWGTGGGNAPMVTQPTDIQEVVGALDTECGGNKMSHQTIASGHLLPIKSFYESSLAQYREDNVSGTIKASGGVAGGGSETFLAQPVAYSFDSLASNSMKSSNPHSGCREVDLSKTVDTFDPNPSKNQGGIAIMQPIPIHDQATRHAGKNGEKTMGKGNGLGIGQPGDPMNTLTKGDHHAVAYNIAPGKGALKDDIHVTDAYISKTIDASGSNPAMHQGGAAILQPIAFHPTQDPITSTDGTTHGLGCGSSGGQASIAIAQPIAFEPGKLKRLGYGDAEPGLAPALRAEAGDNQLAVAQPLAFVQNSRDEVRLMGGDGSHVGALTAEPGAKQQCYVTQPVVLMDQGGSVMNVQTDGTVGTLRRETHGHEPVIMQPIPIDSMNHLGRDNENHSMGDFVPGAPSYTLTKGHSHAVAHEIPVCIGGQHPNAGVSIDQTPTLTSAMGAGGGHVPAVSVAPTLTASNDPSRSPQSTEVTNQVAAVYETAMAVRRLTPVECERLQGFPDGYTNIPWRKAAESPDGPRYKALGNSWAVPVVAWIGKRIDAAIKEKRNG
jgi:site-specific DNA-cytosine methylase